MSEKLDIALRNMEKAAQIVLDELLQEINEGETNDITSNSR